MKLLLQILRGYWLLDYQTASNFQPVVRHILEGKYNNLPELKAFDNVTITDGKTIYPQEIEPPTGSFAIVDIKGILTKEDQPCAGPGMKTIGQQITTLANNPKIQGILLNVDSPGGSVDGTPELAEIVAEYRNKIVAFTDGMIGSAAEWIASSAKEVIANSGLNQIGSIGVMVNWQDVKPMYEAEGVKFHNVVADQSPDKNKIFKDAEDGDYTALKEELLNPIAETFINTMKRNRPNIKDEQLTGKIYFAKDVVGSMIDSIGNMDYALQRLKLLTTKKTMIHV